MNEKLMLEIRQLAEQWCPTKISDATSWKAGFCAFAELVNQLHKQNHQTQSAWIDANIHGNNSSLLDQDVANYHEITLAAYESMNKSIWQDRFGSWHGRG